MVNQNTNTRSQKSEVRSQKRVKLSGFSLQLSVIQDLRLKIEDLRTNFQFSIFNFQLFLNLKSLILNLLPSYRLLPVFLALLTLLPTAYSLLPVSPANAAEAPALCPLKGYDFLVDPTTNTTTLNPGEPFRNGYELLPNGQIQITTAISRAKLLLPFSSSVFGIGSLSYAWNKITSSEQKALQALEKHQSWSKVNLYGKQHQANWELEEQLNSSNTYAEFKDLAKKWKNTEPMWPYLSPEKRTWLMQLTLEEDSFDKTNYHEANYGQARNGQFVITSEWAVWYNSEGEVVRDNIGEDINHDGKIILVETNVENQLRTEDGSIISAVPFVCTDFASGLAEKYGKVNEPVLKYWQPIMVADLFGSSNTYTGSTSGHEIIATYTSSDFSQISNFNNWQFFEPSNDQPVKNIWSYMNGFNVLELAYHDNPLFEDPNYRNINLPVLTGFINYQGSPIPTNSLISRMGVIALNIPVINSAFEIITQPTYDDTN